MILKINNLVKRYNEVLAVDNVNLFIKEGEVYGLLGPNGAGKTTLINTILGLTRYDDGSIEIFGKDLKKHEYEIKKEIGIVPQDLAIYEDLTAYENIAYFGRLYGLRGNLLKERIEEALSFTGLWDRRKDLPKKFSGGMKRRLNIACAIMHHPKLIIMDEPTVGIDPQSRKMILESVLKLNQMGSTIIYTSHYMEEVEAICSNITIVDHGKIIARGTKEELKAMISFEERLNIEVSSVNYNLVEGLKKMEDVKECSLDGKKLLIISKKNANNLSKIIDEIVKMGVEIHGVNIEKPTLEGVFLTLTGRSLRD
ncbi:ABC transporter ATP-binding protein [Alkaliphilus peptidifermentans]|uniref:ABC-2 type transport system ATP-binding protein n=1 Tax=Alkaliphilus peptidifermentans DSM 18978 TaxID=1120976 RepID=A0A1G5KZ25_9FIRM|nr:ABC transporter ATP-binding protein [Alkaliphilus peptidifermentans]SCZ05826.1 ABC-2 type transport system ATP-binding protein [Alkaliphilus peptidifermentans DSM 18978]